MEEIYVGKRVVLTPISLCEKSPKPRMGVVVYVNRKHRYFTAAFEVGKDIIRESFKYSYTYYPKMGVSELQIW